MTAPDYLALPPAGGPTFGRLRFVSETLGNYWLIEEAEPQAVVTAKRLFPGAQGRGPGIAKFPAGPRQVGDVCWFLQRWPMHIVDRERFAAMVAEARTMVEERATVEAAPPPALPATFRGTLRPYQASGTAWLASQRRTLLGDEMGLGKTVQAIAGIAAVGGICLIVPPPHIVRQWEAQLDAFLAIENGAPGDLFGARPRQPLTRHTIRGLKAYVLPQADVYLCHYLLLAAHRERLQHLQPRVVIFDEVQELRHRGTAKYSAAHALAQQAQYCWGLSGTPIYNRGGEIWNVSNIVEMHCLGDWDSFTREWCAGYGSDEVTDPPRLGAHLRREGLMLRRRKADVMADLPPKHRLVQAVDSDDATYHRLIKHAVALAHQAAETGDHLERGRLMRQIDAATRHATGVAKAPAVVHFVRSLVEAGEAVLVFAWHHEVIDLLSEAVAGAVRMTGRESEWEKASARDAFIEGRAPVCILNLRSAAGIDGLQKRDPIVVFAELDWSPAVHSQCEDRANRDGMSRDSTLCYYLVSEFGCDPEMQDRLGLKIDQFRGIMGDEGRAEDEALSAESARRYLDRVMQKLRLEAA